MSTYFVEEDICVIEGWANAKDLTVSFREAGADTIKCLSRGAGAKPHSILEKTIKGNTEPVNNFFKEFGEKRNEAEDLLKGMVGHWNVDKTKIEGIYLTTIGKSKCKEQGLDVVDLTKKVAYLNLSNDKKKKDLMAFYDTLVNENGENKVEYYFSRCFFSGDYDMHDIYQVGKPVVSGLDMKKITPVQQSLIDARKKQLKKKYGLTNNEFAGEENLDYQRIQHGPQCNYIAQMINDNKKAKKYTDINALVDVVCRPSLPVSMYIKSGKWLQISAHGDFLGIVRRMGNKETQTKAQDEEKAINDAIEKYKVSTVKSAIRLIAAQEGKRTNEITIKDVNEKCPQLESTYKDKFKGYFENAKMFTKNIEDV